MSIAHRRLRPAGLLAVTAAFAAAGCSHPARANPKPSPPAASPSPSVSPSPDPIAVATREAVAAYRATFSDVNEAVAHRNWDDPALSRHAGSATQAFLAATARFFVTQGVMLKGLPALRLQVTSTSLTTAPPNVRLWVCVDPRTQRYLDRRTGRPASGFILVPRPQTVLVQQHPQAWTVDAIKAQPKRTC